MNRESPLTTEPTLLIGAITTFIATVVPLLAVTFGWTDELEAMWEAVLLAGWAILSAAIGLWLIRARVTPVASPSLPVGTKVDVGPDAPMGEVVASTTP